MQVTTFSCPHCAANLRIRDRMFVGQTVGCPDCGEQLAIVADGTKGFRVEKVEPHESLPKKRKPGKKKRRPRQKSGISDGQPTARRERPWVANVRAKLTSPVGIAWSAAIVAGGVLLFFMLSGPKRDSNGRAERDGPNTVANGTADPGMPVPVSPWSAPAPDTRARLAQLAVILAEYEKSQQRLPPGTEPMEGLPPEQRFSWQARLAATSKEYGTATPHWDRPWSDPVNERFRTQSIELFRNPDLPATPGRDRLPVSHFVGVAGVGEDGPTLPVDHPRAGIFAYNRSTRLGDIKDGLENTMMIAGVQSRLGGWAVGGRGTIRPFTKTPYVNGPDGFSTGHGDRMLVLMADGSVREVSKETNPVIVRRMAAMADGFTLDPKLPGDPALLKPETRIEPPPVIGKKQPPKKQPAPQVVKQPVRAKRPHVRPEVDKPKEIDFAAALAQPILRFEQTGPQPLGVLLDELEEIAGVPIRFDKRAVAGKLDNRVAVSLKKTTVKHILEALLAEAGLTYKVEADCLRIVAKPPKTKAMP